MRGKLLFIIRKMTYGGAAKVMAFLANRLSYEDYNVNLLTYENNIVVPLLAPTVNHLEFHYSPPNIFAIRRILQLIKVRKLLNEVKPDLIISFLTYPNMVSILASLGTKIPVIISERGDPFVFQSLSTRLRDYIYNFADGYVFQTNGAREYFSKRIREKATVIPNPVISEYPPEKWVGEKEDIIVSVGRFELKQKRQDILIEAFSRIAGKFRDLKLMLFGDGEDESKIVDLIAQLNLENRVILANVTNNVYESIKKAKIFVLSSDYEGIPNALIEAMSIGLPCVSTNCSPGGAAELIRHMENGLLVEVGSVDGMANAMEFLLENPREAEIMGQNAIKINHDLAPNRIIKLWIDYINKYLATV